MEVSPRVNVARKRFDILILPILLCGSEVWNPYRGYYFSTWDKTEVERVHLQSLKRLLGVLNISTRNIMVRAELGRYQLKLKLKQWILSKRHSEMIMICFGQYVKVRQIDKSLTYCMYKNTIIT